jgi:alkylhydroperoxidase family enzyme
MARLPFVERDQAQPEVQEAYNKAQKAMGRVSNFVKLIANHANSLPGFLEWYPRLREGALDIKLRQLAYVKASQLNGCNY